MGSFMSFAVEREMHSIMLAASFHFDRSSVPEFEAEDVNFLVASFRIEKTILRLTYMMLSAWPLYSIEWTAEDVAMVLRPIDTFETDFWLQMNRVMRARLSFREVCELRVKVSEKLREAHLAYLQRMQEAEDADDDDDDEYTKPPTSWKHRSASSYLSMLSIVDLAAMQIVEDILFRLDSDASKLAQLCDVNAQFPKETKIAFPDDIEIESFKSRAPIIMQIIPFMREQLIRMGAARMTMGIVDDLSRLIETSRIEEDIDDMLQGVRDTSRIVRAFPTPKVTKNAEMGQAEIIAALLKTARWDRNAQQLQLGLLREYVLPEDADGISLSTALKDLSRWLETNVMAPAARERTQTYVHAYASVRNIAIHLATHIRAIYLARKEVDEDDNDDDEKDEDAAEKKGTPESYEVITYSERQLKSNSMR
jgi:hypothetical protein